MGAVTFDTSGNLYIADRGADRVRKVFPNGTITAFAGDGNFGNGGVPDASGDSGPAVQAHLFAPSGVAADSLRKPAVWSDRVRRANHRSQSVQMATLSG